VALVTGAARGLGRSVAKAFAEQGVALMLLDVLPDRLQGTAQALRDEGARVETFVADVSQRPQCFAAVEATLAAFGRIDVLANVAGLVRFNRATEVPEAEFEKIMAVNAAGPFWLSQAAIPHLIAAKGNIVNVASHSGLVGSPYIAPYSMSKGAMIQMTRSLAMEYMDEPIRVNCVCPGPMATEIGTDIVMPDGLDVAKIQRYSGHRGQSAPEEVAAMIAFVASSGASAVNGAILACDTGASAG